MGIPELGVVCTHLSNKWNTLCNEFVSCFSFERQTTLLYVVKKTIVGNIAKHTRGNNEVWVFSPSIGLGQQVFLSQTQPIVKRFFAVESTVAANEPVASMSRMCIAAK